MAMTEAVAQPHDRSGRPGRRRPFSALMKKLANLKAASSGDGSRYSGSKRSDAKKRQNNPYPQSGHAGAGAASSPPHSHYSLSSGPSRRLTSVTSLERVGSASISVDEHPPPTTGGRSVAPTVSTEHDACRSILAPSHGEASLAGTSRTINGRRGGGDSTFSSPAPSVRSLTTTLTTIQTVAPNTANGNNNNNNNNNGGGSGGISANHAQPTSTHHHHNSTSQVIHFNQPFPTTASPASAIPPHLATITTTTTTANGLTATSPFHPTTYATATANNLLTDNASILTLASSSKRRRRRSFDTDASVRALAPSSLWGGSRESLPLSVLSATLDAGGPSVTTPTGGGSGGGGGGVGVSGSSGVGMGSGVGVRGERTSIYSATGILMHGGTAAASERSSFYAKHREQQREQQGLDAASVRSGLLGHGRADSVTGSIGGSGAAGAGSLAAGATGTSPLASPREEGEVAEKESVE